VGETGSGKTTVALGLLGYARPGVQVAGGSVQLGDTDLLALSPVELRRRRGRDIAYVPQDPSTGLTPGMRIGDALDEMLAVHAPNETDRGARVAAALREAQLPDDPVFQRRYPFQLSGGQQQRVAIALALICRPRLIVMDEPTTGLDVTTQARLLNVIREIVRDSDTALVYVTHDLGVIRALADEVMVMYGGRVIEHGPVDTLFSSPSHPYTRGLLEAVPRVAAVNYKPRALPGYAVEPWDRPPGCPFAPRCARRTEVCDERMPPVEDVMPSYTVRCFHWSRTLTPSVRVEPSSETAPALGVEAGDSGPPCSRSRSSRPATGAPARGEGARGRCLP
jgi:peptide/nickel transport system ATP-binding protein